MRTIVDRERFGPWALITGASSGIGREFARQLAAAGLNTVLVARRLALLEEAGHAFARDFGVEYRPSRRISPTNVSSRLSRKRPRVLRSALWCQMRAPPCAGLFLSKDRDELARLLRLNTLSHLDIAHHYGKKLVGRGRGGLVFVGAMGVEKGLPYMANDSAAKAYVQALAQALHVELKPLGVHVTVVSPGLTETPVLAKLGLTLANMPMKPMKVEQCVSEAIRALAANRSLIIPGRLNPNDECHDARINNTGDGGEDVCQDAH